MQSKNTIYWVLWLAASAGLALYVTLTLTDTEGDRTVFLPGETTAGHYQIELKGVEEAVDISRRHVAAVRKVVKSL